MAENRAILPVAIQDKIARFPESSYGAHRVTLILDDGTVIKEVYIAENDEIIRVGRSQGIDFDPARVVDAKSEIP